MKSTGKKAIFPSDSDMGCSRVLYKIVQFIQVCKIVSPTGKRNKNETLTDFCTGYLNILNVFFHEFKLLSKVKPHEEKKLRKTIYIDWHHQISLASSKI